MMRDRGAKWVAFRALLALVLVALPALSAQADRDEFESSWPVDADARIDVEIVDGRIEVRGWDKNEVRVKARGRGAADLEVDASNDRVSIRVPMGFTVLPWNFIGGKVDLELRVPFESRIVAKTINGAIRARKLRGTVSFYSVNGQIEVEGALREADFETVSQNIEFRGNGSSANARTISGSIEMHGLSGEVTASTISGSIEVRGRRLDRVELGSVSGSIELEGSLTRRARVRLKTHSGSVELRVPENTSARFEAETFSGSIDNELGPDGRRVSRHGSGSRLYFDAGEAKARVSIDTFSGSISIERSKRDYDDDEDDNDEDDDDD